MKLDYRIISSVIDKGSKVLDLGCGGGELMAYISERNVADVQGIELDEDEIYKCVAKGLSVFHGDLDAGLKGFPDKSFDFIILNQSLQEMNNINYVIEEALRVGKKVIVGFPNFAHINSRLKLFFSGRSPVTKALPYSWSDTPNIRFLSIRDFREYCQNNGIKVLEEFYLGNSGLIHFLPNLFAGNSIFVIQK